MVYSAIPVLKACRNRDNVTIRMSCYKQDEEEENEEEEGQPRRSSSHHQYATLYDANRVPVFRQLNCGSPPHNVLIVVLPIH
jgi:hypothetical protein